MFLVCVALIITDSRYDHLNRVRQAISTVLTPIQSGVNAPFQLFNWSNNWISSRNALIEENNTLRSENFKLKAISQRLNIINQENARLHALLNSANTINERAIVAKLVKVALEPYSQQITLDKGLMHNVYLGQSVIGTNGIMGQIVHVNEFTSTALLITDGKHDIPVQVNRTGLRSIARGTGKSNELELLHIPNNADIVIGDLIISSGFGGRFPRNYPVAEITQIQHDPSKSFVQVMARPTAAIDRANEVLLIWPQTLNKPSEPLEEKPSCSDKEDCKEQVNSEHSPVSDNKNDSNNERH